MGGVSTFFKVGVIFPYATAAHLTWVRQQRCSACLGSCTSEMTRTEPMWVGKHMRRDHVADWERRLLLLRVVASAMLLMEWTQCLVVRPQQLNRLRCRMVPSGHLSAPVCMHTVIEPPSCVAIEARVLPHGVGRDALAAPTAVRGSQVTNAAVINVPRLRVNWGCDCD
ncbi:hypothetical protein EDB92DRAFT_1559311 [Lactarius akahatsu]|uniref:Uncharacterized protein n=1 Tax=Lactarius akahatsu TaxID=416441 RepID=A0AAD4LA81_9AGAM|nr:hypothetical protein EDB92DRAFT_1559311 [Lactarius akahatsu]